MEAISIRMAREGDAAALLAIYAPYVRETAISFEYAAPSPEEFARRIRETLKSYPWLVAEENGRPVGYAYASAFNARAAYQWTAETSIYVEKELRGRGIGGKLYAALEALLKKQNILTLTAHISCECGEETGKNASVAFHARMGYRMSGRFEKCGYKHGAWRDVVWMQKFLGKHPARPEEMRPIGEIGG
ncbi:MAG TPA: GNAT family N-acetyltransferase [Clostridia bacterium]|nr:GNAT family N-acetyltransferase [Clostridia bacterium]